MRVSYLSILTLCGLVGGSLIFAGIYLDAHGRRLSNPGRLLLATGFGAVGFAGFFVPYVYEERLAYLYFQVVKPRPIAVSPYEWLAVSLGTGVLLCGFVGLLYAVGARHVLFRTDRTRNGRN